MFISDFQIFLLFLTTLLGGVATSWFYFRFNRNEGHQNQPPKQSIGAKEQQKPQPLPPNPQLQIFEVFDYKGLKIINDNGNYTVNDQGVVRTFGPIEHIPQKYRAILLEFISGEFSGGAHCYLENTNGKYKVLTPDGRKKEYNDYSAIPDEVKKMMA